MVFGLQLDVNTVWLREAGARNHGSAFFPDSENKKFDFSPDVGIFVLRFIVEGCSSRSTSVSSGANRVFSTSPGTSSGPVTPIFSNKKTSITVKIVQAQMLKKPGTSRPEFRPISQTFIDITESTANVMYLSHIIKEKWGVNFHLVSADGMRIEDS